MCPIDGKVRLQPDMIWIDADADVYRYTCPRCWQGIHQAADAGTTNILRSAGVLDIDEIVAGEVDALDDITSADDRRGARRPLWRGARSRWDTATRDE
jgi:hypothetical protein